MKYTIDRFEGDFAVVELESKKYINIPRDGIPKDAKEGNIITVTVDKQATVKKQKEIDDAVKDMWIE